MNTIFYFTGTGNSLKVAKDIAILTKAELSPISKSIKHVAEIKVDGVVGFIYPEYYYGLPKIVAEFLEKIDLSKVDYIFAVSTYAKGAGSISLVKKLLKKKGQTLNAGFYVKAVDCFVLWTWNVTSNKKHYKLHRNANLFSQKIAKIVNNREDKISFKAFGKIGRFLFRYKNFIKRVNSDDNAFYARETCTSCGICSKVCPTQNIQIENGSPKWLSQSCQRCLACFHLCPVRAIEYGKATAKKSRYKNPYIEIKELMISNTND